MDLKEYLRGVLNKKWIPLVKKKECEICGKTDKLEVHHVKQFIFMVEDALENLKLKYLDTDDYSEKELQLIRNVVMGMHLESEYLTLCDNCHDELHRELGRKKGTMFAELKINIKNNIDSEFLLNNLDKYCNIKMFKDMQEEFKRFLKENLIISPKVNHGSLGLKTINNYFTEHNINYSINGNKEKSNKDNNRDKKYWIITKNKYIK